MIATRLTVALIGLAVVLSPGDGLAVTKSTNEVDAQICGAQLNLIYSALQHHQKQKLDFPPWLSDLIPNDLHDQSILACPYVRGTGNVKNWRRGLTVFQIFDDPKSATSYGYELCPVQVNGMPGTTCRQAKQRQMQVLGSCVPIVRCLAHKEPLNLAFDGSIYLNRSDGEWEDLLSTNSAELAVLHARLSETGPLKAVRLLLRPRPHGTGSRCLDLSNYYNASLFHLGHIEYEGRFVQDMTYGLQTINGINYEIRGLIHLAGTSFPVGFPRAVGDIAVRRRCTRVHLLYGAFGEAPEGATVANLHFRLENGRKHTIPIVYGTDVKTRWFDAEDKDETENPKPAWTSPSDRNGPSGRSLRLYVKSWTNPEPDVAVQSIDFASEMTPSAPFLVAITTE